MAQPYIGEIRIFGGNFAPVGWAFCSGQQMPISENETLFQLIGTSYGGDGESTFNLPDLRGRLPIHQGNGFILAENGGAEQVTLTVQQIPVHTHQLTGTQSVGNQLDPGGAVPAQTAGGLQPYFENPPNAAMNAGSIGPAGGSQPHTNFQPYQCVNFIISLFGIFPSPT